MKPGFLIVAMLMWQRFAGAGAEREWGNPDYYPGKVGSRLLNLFVNRIFSDRIGSCSNHQLVKKPQQSFVFLRSAHVKFKLGGTIPVNVIRT